MEATKDTKPAPMTAAERQRASRQKRKNAGMQSEQTVNVMVSLETMSYWKRSAEKYGVSKKELLERVMQTLFLTELLKQDIPALHLPSGADVSKHVSHQNGKAFFTLEPLS